MAPPQPLDVDNNSDTQSDVSSGPPFAPSDGSSYTSQDFPSSPVLEYGEGFNGPRQVYGLPASRDELERLRACIVMSCNILTNLLAELQHLIFHEILGKYPPVLADIMVDDVPGEAKACLDLGSGSGDW
jgi:hypothetical protein